MRTRIVWLELSLILMVLSFAEFGEVLREIRTDVVLDWFVSLAPLASRDATRHFRRVGPRIRTGGRMAGLRTLCRVYLTVRPIGSTAP